MPIRFEIFLHKESIWTSKLSCSSSSRLSSLTLSTCSNVLLLSSILRWIACDLHYLNVFVGAVHQWVLSSSRNNLVAVCCLLPTHQRWRLRVRECSWALLYLYNRKKQGGWCRQQTCRSACGHLRVSHWRTTQNRGGSRNFWLGGSKLWFRKDCWTLLRQITSPPHPPHPLPPVAVARYNSMAAYRLLGFYS